MTVSSALFWAVPQGMLWAHRSNSSSVPGSWNDSGRAALPTTCGTAQIPERWLEVLELREVITEIAGDLFDMKQWRIGEYGGARDNDRVLAKYPPC